MLLGNRRKQNEEQNWSLVLSPLRNEIDKKKVASKISEVFSLSLEEAFDLTANTPIILLDNLSRPVAVQVKEFFSSTGADMVLTNDIFYKRKCYRTVWPEPPNLSFLSRSLGVAAAKKASIEPERKMQAEEALNAIRSVSVPVKSHTENDASLAQDTAKQRELVEELERWRQECQQRRMEVEKLHHDISRLQQTPGSQSGVDAEKQLQEKDRMIDELRKTVADSETKYRSLREEYKQARSIFEDKLLRINQTHVGASDKVQMLEDRVKGLQERNRELEFNLARARQELDQYKTEETHKSEQRDSRMQDALRSFEAEKRRNLELMDEIEKLKSERQELEGRVTAQDQSLVEIRESRDLARLKLEDLEKRLSASQSEFARFKEQSSGLINLKAEYDKLVQESSEKESRLRTEIERLGEEAAVLRSEAGQGREELERKRLQLEELREKHQTLDSQWQAKSRSFQELERQFLNLEKAFQELRSQSARYEKSLNEKQIVLEEKLKELEQVQKEKAMINQNLQDAQQMMEVQNGELSRIRQSVQDDLKMRDAEISRLADQIRQAERIIQGLQAERTEFESLLAARDSQLENREREAETLRRQMKDLKNQLDHKDMINRRTQLNSSLVEKEEMLKQLVAEQRRVEREIREREDLMRQVLSRQEHVEKELIEIKQTQRHLQEQAKKEQRSSNASHRQESELLGGAAAEENIIQND